jgi:hypothetical protein
VTADSRPLVTDDIAAEIAEVLAPLLPGANPDRLAAQIAALRLLPAHARGLLAHLQAQPDALTSGAATGPAALRALLDVLAAEHPGVQRIRCHKCGAQGALPYRRDGGSICGPCYRRTHRKVCVRCGEEGQPAFRESGGIVCSRCSYRDPARWRACASCGTMAHVAYRVDGEPLCQTCGPRKLYTCSSCGRQNRPAHAVTSQGPLCSIVLSPQPRTRVHEMWSHHGGGPGRRPRCRNMDLQPMLGSSDDDVQRVRSRQALCEGKHLRPPGVLNLPSRCKPSKDVRPVRADRSDPDHTAARTGVRTLLPAPPAQSGRLRQLSGNPPAGRHQ